VFKDIVGQWRSSVAFRGHLKLVLQKIEPLDRTRAILSTFYSNCMSRLCGVLARSEVIFVENRNFSPTRVLDGRVGSGRVIILLTFLCGLGSTVFLTIGL